MVKYKSTIFPIKMKLWTNDPVIEVNPFTNTMKPSAYTRSRMPRRASIATTALATDVDFVGRASIESGIAKMQNLLSRVSDRT
ncbi:uncharacterized protein TNCT_472031 [Trichonephila clavata]|uniref:Uncharacterized protein n=1 Tax=Trichonephila clavata TaxID=2740835 RepID=A0A8X6FAT6_TRICU|nr:uncharacterized protein TNCT_472031 [Trichonephila clavata]